MKKLEPVDQEYTYAQTLDGRIMLVGARRDLPVTLPSGEKSYVRQTIMLPDANGRQIDPSNPRLVTCQSCATFPLREDSTKTCVSCEATICTRCGVRLPLPDDADPSQEPQYVCTRCAQRARRQGLIRFFLSFQ